MNWLEIQANPTASPPKSDLGLPCESSLHYWVARLKPLYDPSPGSVVFWPPSKQSPTGGKEIVVIIGNRTGVESGEFIFDHVFS